MLHYDILCSRLKYLRNGGLNKINYIHWKSMCLVDLFCLEIIVTKLFEHLHSLLRVSSLFNNKENHVFFLFCLAFVFHGRGIPFLSLAAVGEHSTVPFHLISFSIEEMS